MTSLERVLHEIKSRRAGLHHQNVVIDISRVAGNIPDDILCSATGANDARYRGGLACAARDIARAALEPR